MDSQITVPRLIEFIGGDLDILREFWRIRRVDKSGRSRVTLEDVRTFVSKLDTLIEFWRRLQILNGAGSPQKKCVKCDLRKKQNDQEFRKLSVKKKDFSGQTENFDEQRSVVSSSNENSQSLSQEIIQRTCQSLPESREKTPEIPESREETLEIPDFDVIPAFEDDLTDKENSPRKTPKTSPKKKKENSRKTPENTPQKTNENPNEAQNTEENEMQNLDGMEENVPENSQLEITSVHSQIEESFSIHPSKIVVAELNDTHVPDYVPSPFDPERETTPVPDEMMDFIDEDSLNTSTEIKTEPLPDSTPQLIQVQLEMVTIHHDEVKSESDQVSPDSSSMQIEQDSDDSEVQIRKEPQVLLDRRLADRVLVLNNQGINVQFNEENVLNLPSGTPKNPKNPVTRKNSVNPKNPVTPKNPVNPKNYVTPKNPEPRILLQDNEENMERCRQYLIQRLSSKKQKPFWKKKGKKKRKNLMKNAFKL